MPARSNHGEPSPLVARCADDIERFGRLLERVSRFEPIYIFVPIHKLLESNNFSDEFQNAMVFPLVALFFGTGNQTPYVSSAVIARVFLDPELRLFEYDRKRLLATVPTMFAFPPLEDVFEKITDHQVQLEEEQGAHVLAGDQGRASPQWRDGPFSGTRERCRRV